MPYNTLKTAMARQRATVDDLYGLLDVSPSVDEVGIRRAYEAIARKLHPEVPSNVVSPFHLFLHSLTQMIGVLTDMTRSTSPILS